MSKSKKGATPSKACFAKSNLLFVTSRSHYVFASFAVASADNLKETGPSSAFVAVAGAAIASIIVGFALIGVAWVLRRRRKRQELEDGPTARSSSSSSSDDSSSHDSATSVTMDDSGAIQRSFS